VTQTLWRSALRVSVARHNNALRLLKMEFPDEEYVLIPKDKNPGTTRCCARDVCMISFSQFEELMIAAQTAEGKSSGQGYQHTRSGFSQN